MERWKGTPPGEFNKREEIFSQVCAINALVEWLAAQERQGQKADKELNRLASSGSNAKETIK